DDRGKPAPGHLARAVLRRNGRVHDHSEVYAIESVGSLSVLEELVEQFIGQRELLMGRRIMLEPPGPRNPPPMLATTSSQVIGSTYSTIIESTPWSPGGRVLIRYCLLHKRLLNYLASQRGYMTSQCKKAPSPENQSSPQDNAESILTPEEDAEEQSAISYNLRSRKGCQKKTLFLSCWYLMVWGDHDDNSFIQQQVWIAQTLNISNWWVCSHIPAHSQTGVPVLAIPLKSPDLTGGPRPFNKIWNSNDTWEAVGINASKWISVVEGKGHWCWVCNGTGLDLGKSRCLQHIVANGVWDYSNKTKKWRAGYGDMNFFSTWDQTEKSISYSSYSHANNTAPRKENYPVPFGGYYSSFANTYMTNGCNRPFPALIGHHWVCGTRAYTALPANWSGIRYPARLFPQFRVLGTFPRERFRNFRRKRRDLTDAQWYVNNISPLTWEEAVGGSFIPLGGVIHHAKRLLRLQAVAEIMANETGESLRALAKETGAI
ncbi:unnamed protein product, partial [Eretmochelys imbricata]